MKLAYAVVFEQTPNNYSAYSPDLPGCVGTAATWTEVRQIMRDAVALYIEELTEKGEPVPMPQMSVQDALTFHSNTLAENATELSRTFSDGPATISTTVVMVDIDVAVPAGAR